MPLVSSVALSVVTVLARVDEYLGFLDRPANPQHRQRGQQTGEKQYPPGVVLGQPGEQSGRQQHRKAIAERPPGLDGAHHAPAHPGIDGLAEQHGAGGPFPAKAQSLQASRKQ
jgi:hypothetical protein